MAIEQWLIDAPKTIDLELVRRVRANLMAGSMNIIAHDEPGTRVEVSSLDGRSLKVSIDGDTLLINHPQLDWNEFGDSARAIIDQPKVQVSVLVPKHVDVNVKATSADVLVVGVEGDIAITTVGGEHFCDRTGGKLTLTSAAGELSVREHRGAVDATSGTGDVTVTGPITHFTGNTISGSTVVDVSVEGSVPSRISAASVSGAVTVRLPIAARPVCTITTVTSKAQVGPRLIDALYGKQFQVGRVTDGEAYTDVRVNTVAGRVVVLRDGEAWPTDADWPEDAKTAPAEGAADAGTDSGADSTEGAEPTKPAQAAAWPTAPNPNLNLQDAPRPTGNFAPTVGADQAADAATDAPDVTASSGTNDAAGPDVPFEPGANRTASGSDQ